MDKETVECAYALLMAIKTDKASHGITPDDPTLLELFNQLRAAMNELYRQGRIKVSDTVNSKLIQL